MEPMARILSGHVQTLADGSPGEVVEEPPPDARKETTAIEVDISTISNSATTCQCCCHYISWNRSPRVVDRIFGTLFAAYSGVSCAAPRCNVLGCARSCAGPDIALSLTYFFPLWLLSWGINLRLTHSTREFDHNFRMIQCVEYSSPIFRYAYEGDVSRMKALLKGRLGSPFDMTFEPRKSLLGVWSSLYHHGHLC